MMFWTLVVFIGFGTQMSQAAISKVVAANVKPSSFTCKGRTPGYYADLETECQTYHFCDGINRQFSYTCPNMTRFQQRMLVCDHWFMVDCRNSERDYSANLLIGQKDKLFVGPEEDIDYIRSGKGNRKFSYSESRSQPFQYFTTTQRPVSTQNTWRTFVPQTTPRSLPTESTPRIINWIPSPIQDEPKQQSLFLDYQLPPSGVIRQSKSNEGEDGIRLRLEDTRGLFFIPIAGSQATPQSPKEYFVTVGSEHGLRFKKQNVNPFISRADCPSYCHPSFLLPGACHPCIMIK